MHLLFFVGTNHGDFFYKKACDKNYEKIFKTWNGRYYESIGGHDWTFTKEQVTTMEDMVTCRECLNEDS